MRRDSASIRQISRRFPGRWLQGYVRGKLGSDPLYAAAAAEIVSAQPVPVLDVGCGIGLFAHYLRAHACEADYVGLDLDAKKIDLARAAARNLQGIHFEHGACDSLPEWQGHVLILDTLHYLAADGQQQLLCAAAVRVAPGASLIIRSVLRDASWRFRVTRLEEGFMRSIRWMRYPVRHYPDADELGAPLLKAGLSVRITPLWGRTPFNSYLIVGRAAS